MREGKARKTKFVLIALLLTLLAGCGKNSDSTDGAAAPYSKNYAFQDQQSQTETGDMKTTEKSSAAHEGDSQNSKTQSVDSLEASDPQRKLVKRQTYEVQTKEYDKFRKLLSELIDSYAGYVELSDESGQAYEETGNRYASYTIRVPAEHLNEFKDKINKEAIVVNFSEQVEDVTLHYVDTESHIKALKTEQESLMELLSKADKLEDIMAIQTQLTQVRYELENYESQLRTYDNSIEYATVILRVSEVEHAVKTSSSFAGRLKERFSDNLYHIKSGFTLFTVWFLGAAPYWFLLAAAAVIFVWIMKKVKRRDSFRNTDDTRPSDETKTKRKTETEKKESSQNHE